MFVFVLLDVVDLIYYMYLLVLRHVLVVYFRSLFQHTSL